MRKFLLVVIIIAVALGNTACSNTTTTNSLSSWKVGTKIDEKWEHIPKIIFNDDGSLKNREEVTQILFGVETNSIIVKIPYTIITPGTKRIDVTPDEVKLYSPDHDLFQKLESGELVESIRLWMPFVDKNGEIWCWEFVCKSDYSTHNRIENAGPNMVIHTNIGHGIAPWKLTPTTFAFIVSSDFVNRL